MKQENRIPKDTYYLNIAREISKRGTCLRRNFGSVIVKDDCIVSTGYTGPPRGAKHCEECLREKLNIPKGERYELCRSVHAEMNAIINASKEEMKNAILYLSGVIVICSISGKKYKNCGRPPCLLCKRVIINAGIGVVVVEEEGGERTYYVNDWINEV